LEVVIRNFRVAAPVRMDLNGKRPPRRLSRLTTHNTDRVGFGSKFYLLAPVFSKGLAALTRI
jgi:hypothetical protein